MIICDPGIKPKNKHLQSILASSRIRLWKLKNNNPVVCNAKEVLLQTEKAKLQGFYTAGKNSTNLFILLHGWEGSAQSTYIQTLSNTLYKQKNASIFRLNFRDHGDTHHLNEGIFHSCRLNEVVQAIKQINEKFPHKNLYLCGFSLGGNFSLRVAANAYKEKIPLTGVFAVSPPINPKNSMLCIEKSSLYSKYFMKKWKRSLSKKQRLFPNNFDDSQFKTIKSLDKLTEILIVNHSDYNSTDEYFAAYQITKKTIDQIQAPCHVLTSWDDPVIPFEDFKLLQDQTNIHLVTTKQGGHCGFINSWRLSSWIEQYIIKTVFKS
jgi:hypothetical protein